MKWNNQMNKLFLLTILSVLTTNVMANEHNYLLAGFYAGEEMKPSIQRICSIDSIQVIKISNPVTNEYKKFNKDKLCSKDLENFLLSLNHKKELVENKTNRLTEFTEFFTFSAFKNLEEKNKIKKIKSNYKKMNLEDLDDIGLYINKKGILVEAEPVIIKGKQFKITLNYGFDETNSKTLIKTIPNAIQTYYFTKDEINALDLDSNNHSAKYIEYLHTVEINLIENPNFLDEGEEQQISNMIKQSLLTRMNSSKSSYLDGGFKVKGSFSKTSAKASILDFYKIH